MLSSYEYHGSSDLSRTVDNMLRTSRAMSESRILDPFWHPRGSWEPLALMDARSTGNVIGVTIPSFRASSPIRFAAERDLSLPPPRQFWEYPTASQRYAMSSYDGPTPWSTTGFYYSPRYPESFRGTASTQSIPFPRRYYDTLIPSAYSYDYFRYPSRRFIPSYRPIRYTRRY